MADNRTMSKAAISMGVYSIYLLALGAVLVVVPNLLLGMLGIAETQEVWIRTAGVLLLLMGTLYLLAARQELRAVFHWSVLARLSVPLFLIAFVILGLAPPMLVLIGVIDALGAIWTAAGLRADAAA